MGQKTPRVTVVTPTYNRAHLLAETVRSVLSQTFTDFEYIIISDGSTDSTNWVVQSLAESDHRIRFVSLPHTGQVGTLNKLFDMAEGEYVAWLSDDDLWDETFLETVVGHMDANPDALVVYADYRTLHGDREMPFLDKRGCALTYDVLAYGCFISACLSLLRRSGLVRLKETQGFYFDPIGGKLHGDWTFFLGLYRIGRFIHVCKPLGSLRIHAEQDSRKTASLVAAFYRAMVRRKYGRIGGVRLVIEFADFMMWRWFGDVLRKIL